MNCPSRTEPLVPDEWNQSPNHLSADSTTRSDLEPIAGARLRQDHKTGMHVEPVIASSPGQDHDEDTHLPDPAGSGGAGAAIPSKKRPAWGGLMLEDTLSGHNSAVDSVPTSLKPWWKRCLSRTRAVLVKYAKFVGPGFIIAVAYIDPGNYATDVAAGASYQFRLLFMILLSNIFAIFLQSLCIKLGSVTGLNLAQMCKAHFPPWLNYLLYAFAEAAIIATDIAEVIGTAIALNLLLHIPLVAGCAISIVDVLFILLFYRPNGRNMAALRAFEFFVTLLVLGVVICFCFQLSLIRGVTVGQVFHGYLPSHVLVEGQGLYQACGILGATVMPHSLYLGSGIIQARLLDFDIAHNNIHPSSTGREGHGNDNDDNDDDANDTVKYQPSLAAIRSCMTYSIIELAISLFTFALFVNSAILIVAGASLYDVNGSTDADLFGIHDLLAEQLAPAAGTIFALALLLSGTSAGIVCTIAGQMVSEGQLTIRIKPWLRRLLTRSISITPSIIIAGAIGKEGLSTALQASQVALSVLLPFVSAPLIYFTCRNKYMTVGGATHSRNHDSTVDNSPDDASEFKFRNHWITTVFAILIWGIIVVMNVALLVLLGLGKS